jgi:hypothetical protein
MLSQSKDIMIQFLSPAVGTLLGLIIAIIGWAFRLEGRVNTQEALFVAQEKSLAQKHDDLKEFIQELMNSKFEDVYQRLTRIERNGNGHFRG